MRKRLRIDDPPERGIKNPVPAIRDESVAILGAAQVQLPGAARRRKCGLDGVLRRAETERHDLDRQGETAERIDPFRVIGDDHHARGCRRDDLFPQQRSASALDQAQVGRDLVGAIDGEIELRHLVQGGERYGRTRGVVAGRLGGRHRDHVEPGAHALTQELDEMLGGRAGAEAEPHARTHEFERAGGGGTFLSVDIHGVPPAFAFG